MDIDEESMVGRGDEWVGLLKGLDVSCRSADGFLRRFLRTNVEGRLDQHYKVQRYEQGVQCAAPRRLGQDLATGFVLPQRQERDAAQLSRPESIFVALS